MLLFRACISQPFRSYRKFKAALCVICCLAITIALIIFVGPLVTGNVLGAVAAKPS